MKKVPKEIREAWDNEDVSPEEVEEICEEVESQVNQTEVKQNGN